LKFSSHFTTCFLCDILPWVAWKLVIVKHWVFLKFVIVKHWVFLKFVIVKHWVFLKFSHKFNV
jgi:hypothetical protein